VEDPDTIFFTCSSKQQYNARILMQSLPLVLEAKHGEDAILEAFTPAYWLSARSMFSKDDHGNYVSRQDHLQGKGTAALKALDNQDDGAMEIKIGSYEDVVVDRADIPAPDLILNMEFLFAAKLTPAGLLQRTSVASAMEPSVGEATKASLGASTLAGTSVMDQSAVTKASFMDQSAVTKASFMSHTAAGTAASPMDQSRASHGLPPFRLDQGPAGQDPKDDTSVMSEDSLDTLTTKDYNDRPTHPPVPLPGETTEWRVPEETLPPIPSDSEWINFGRGDLRAIRERAYIMSTDLKGLTYDQKAVAIGYQCWVAGCIYKHTQPYSCDFCMRKVHLGCGTRQDYYHPGDDHHIYCCAVCKYADNFGRGYTNTECWVDTNAPIATLGAARLDRICRGSMVPMGVNPSTLSIPLCT
jgi:hypothetical protein